MLEKNRIRRRTPHARKLANIARNKKYKEDLNFRLSVSARNRIRRALKLNLKSKSTLSLLGCSIDELKIHLEKQWIEGMSWDNYGYRGWHMDHIIPCNKFDLTKPEEQAKCFHYTNIQPLWMQDNIGKGAK